MSQTDRPFLDTQSSIDQPRPFPSRPSQEPPLPERHEGDPNSLDKREHRSGFLGGENHRPSLGPANLQVDSDASRATSSRQHASLSGPTTAAQKSPITVSPIQTETLQPFVGVGASPLPQSTTSTANSGQPTSSRGDIPTGPFGMNFKPPMGAAHSTLPDKLYLIKTLLIDIFAVWVYHALMFHLPDLYRTRIMRVFDYAERSLLDVALLLAQPHPSDTSNVDTATQHHTRLRVVSNTVVPRTIARLRRGTGMTISTLDRNDEPLSYKKMKDSWDDFTEALLIEWATFNIITVLLLSALIAILQIDAAAQDIVIRTAALLSLVFALLSLVSGCIYIGRFHQMRKPYKGAHWAWQVVKTPGNNLWNAWVFLAMPAVWLAWSLLSFLACILAYIWRTGDPAQAPVPFTRGELLASRILVTAVLGVGFIYLLLTWIKFREYEAMYQASTLEIIKQWLARHGARVEGGAIPSHPSPLSRIDEGSEREHTITISTAGSDSGQV
ncbi:hypothetical protein BDN72DRAFT_847063 [Pluteus cervinus]|uniref:Uncharacterized protein n=1 Tax=Pluteus cervinus TaxID=181527 RepID=A0ACD3AEA2_9AGAR|nr:hypothetical protein BDN72DRAFT_847063 [Pluteus cervinus]